MAAPAPFFRCRAAWLAALWLAVSGNEAAAVTTYSEPSLIYTVKIPGPAAAPGTIRTYLGVQQHPGTIYVGTVDSVAGNSFQAAGLENPSQLSFLEPGRSYYALVLSGSGRGKVLDITQFTSTSFVCAEAVGPWVGPGTNIRVRPHSRINDLFGADNRFGFAAATEVGLADNIVFWDSDAQHERVFYYHLSRQRWEEEANSEDAGNTLIRFPHGLYIVRRSPGTLRLSISGEAGAEPILLPVRQGMNVFSLPVNLSCSLDAVVPGDSVISGPNAASADLLILEEPTTHTTRGPFYRLDRDGSTVWREVGVDDSDAPLAPLDFLSTLVVQRKGPPGFVLVEGSLVPPAVPRPPLPPDPEAGEVELTGEFKLPPMPPGDLSLTVQVSTDLQAWSTFATPIHHPDNRVTFTLPAGQTRAFYRLAITLSQ